MLYLFGTIAAVAAVVSAAVVISILVLISSAISDLLGRK